MAKYDGVVEAVRYSPDGKLSVARVYERRGPTWSDRVLISREELIRRLKAGQKYYHGNRQRLMGGTFDMLAPIQLSGQDGQEVLVARVESSDCDQLEGVPRF